MTVSELKSKIVEEAKKRGTVILAHTYQNPDIIDIADVTGDSFFLSQKAKDLTEKREYVLEDIGKNKTVLLLNDTDRFFHRFECKSKNSQDEDVKNLITFSRYGMYKFKHFGERNGKIVFLIR